jgi:hypothetical protein
MIRSILIIGFIAATTLCSAQVVEEPKPKVFHVQDVTVTAGFGLSRSTTLQMSDFLKLHPESQILKEDMSGYIDSYYGYFETVNTFGVLVGMKIRDKNGQSFRKNPTLRLGVNYGSGVYFSANKYFESRAVVDTLVSQQSGQMYYTDSINVRAYGASYNSDQLRIDLSLLYGTNADARWSFYGGFGITSGISLFASTETAYSETTYERTLFGQGGQYAIHTNSNREELRRERINNKTNVSFTGYVPLGLDFRIGKKRPFWKQVHLIYELRPALTITNIPELGVYPEAQFLQQFGLKVRW